MVLDAAADPTTFLPGHSTEPTVVRKTYGDVDAAFRAAHLVVEDLELSVGRHSGVPLETRGAIGRYDTRATCWNYTAPPRSRIRTASQSRKMFGRAARRASYEGHVGGGFGIRGELYPEDILVCLRGAAA